MKRKDVIKGLECCTRGVCIGCPYVNSKPCRSELMEDALYNVKIFDEIITLFKESR